jgi:predicted nucleotidyltransferase
MATDLRAVLAALAEQQVEFVIIGGVALVASGSSRVTEDLDICYGRSKENLSRLASALAPFRPTLRGVPPELPFVLDAQSLRSGLNFTLSTTAGDLDLLGEVPGVGMFADVSKDAIDVDLLGCRVLIMSLDALERAKRAAGRAKDLLDLAEIRELRKQRG